MDRRATSTCRPCRPHRTSATTGPTRAGRRTVAHMVKRSARRDRRDLAGALRRASPCRCSMSISRSPSRALRAATRPARRGNQPARPTAWTSRTRGLNLRSSSSPKRRRFTSSSSFIRSASRRQERLLDHYFNNVIGNPWETTIGGEPPDIRWRNATAPKLKVVLPHAPAD